MLQNIFLRPIIWLLRAIIAVYHVILEVYYFIVSPFEIKLTILKNLPTQIWDYIYDSIAFPIARWLIKHSIYISKNLETVKILSFFLTCYLMGAFLFFFIGLVLPYLIRIFFVLLIITIIIAILCFPFWLIHGIVALILSYIHLVLFILLIQIIIVSYWWSKVDDPEWEPFYVRTSYWHSYKMLLFVILWFFLPYLGFYKIYLYFTAIYLFWLTVGFEVNICYETQYNESAYRTNCYGKETENILAESEAFKSKYKLLYPRLYRFLFLKNYIHITYMQFIFCLLWFVIAPDCLFYFLFDQDYFLRRASGATNKIVLGLLFV